MSLSDNYPDIRPVWMNDYANAGVIDPRCSFTRSDSTPSNVHYWSSEDHLSSENLVTQSTPDGSWSRNFLSPTYSQTGPYTGANATLLTEIASSGNAYYAASPNFPLSSGTTYTYSLWVKKQSGTREYVQLRPGGIGAGKAYTTFHLSGAGSVTQTGGSLFDSSSITAAGSAGWYKLVLTLTMDVDDSASSLQFVVATSSGNELPGIVGDAGNSFLVFGAQVSTTGETVLNETSGQTHREYAATLKSVSYSGQPRFEYEPTGDREARGLLIESSSQNLLPNGATGYNSSNVFAWNTTNGNQSQNAAIAPTGQLEATHFYEDTATGLQQRIHANVTASAAVYTVSGYFKYAGRDIVLIRVGNAGTLYGAKFQFSTETSEDYGQAAFTSHSVTSVGGGWYRFVGTTPTLTAGTASTYVNLFTGGSSGNSVNHDGDGYSGVMFYGLQFEANAFPSSLISTVDSASTRTGDSLSADTADIGYTGGPVTLFAESSTQTPSYNSNNRGVVDLSEPASSNNRVMIYNRGAQAGGFFVNADNVQQGSGFGGITDDSYTKVGVSVDTNSIKHCVNGVTVTTDTSAVIPDRLTKMFIGQTRSGSGFGGHIKRIYLYPEALTETNLQELTS